MVSHKWRTFSNKLFHIIISLKYVSKSINNIIWTGSIHATFHTSLLPAFSNIHMLWTTSFWKFCFLPQRFETDFNSQTKFKNGKFSVLVISRHTNLIEMFYKFLFGLFLLLLTMFYMNHPRKKCIDPYWRSTGQWTWYLGVHTIIALYHSFLP